MGLQTIPKTSEDPRRIARSINRITADTTTFSMASAGTKTFTVPADGAASAASNAQNIRAILDELAKKGIITLTKT
jgi:hypothetical protein